MRIEEIRDKISESGLKVTPQRIAVYQAIMDMNDHPTAEMIKNHVARKNPSISLATVYKTLEAFVNKNLIRKIKTEEDLMRYDPILEEHHHLYDQKNETIADYYNDELNQLIRDYFKTNDIPNFKIEDIKLHIIGEFTDEKNEN
ncbi:MAG: transcriptional repressor [Bacteroidales bacterium]|nr:transcriptional repressor [Bacteroidales bacterium]